MNVDSIVKVKVYFFKKGTESYHSLVEDLVWLGRDGWENFTEDIVKNDISPNHRYINDCQFVRSFDKDLVFIEDCFAFEFQVMDDGEMSGVECEVVNMGEQETFDPFKEMLVDLAKKVHEEDISQKYIPTSLGEMLVSTVTTDQKEILTVTMLTLWNYSASRSYYDDEVDTDWDLIGIMDLSPLRIRSVEYDRGELKIGNSNV